MAPMSESEIWAVFSEVDPTSLIETFSLERSETEQLSLSK